MVPGLELMEAGWPVTFRYACVCTSLSHLAQGILETGADEALSTCQIKRCHYIEPVSGVLLMLLSKLSRQAEGIHLEYGLLHGLVIGHVRRLRCSVLWRKECRKFEIQADQHVIRGM
jgi:hypothetical protein